MKKDTEALLEQYYNYLEEAYGAESLVNEVGLSISEQAAQTYSKVEQNFKKMCTLNSSPRRLPAELFHSYVSRSIPYRKADTKYPSIVEKKLELPEGKSKADKAINVPVHYPEVLYVEIDLAQNRLNYIKRQEVGRHPEGYKYYIKFPYPAGYDKALDETLAEYEHRFKIEPQRYAQIWENNPVAGILKKAKQAYAPEKANEISIYDIYQIAAYTEASLSKVSSIKMAAHFIEHVNKPKSLFSDLQEPETLLQETTTTEDKLEAFYLSELSTPEHKIIIAISRLLNERSKNTTDPKREDYFIGDELIKAEDSAYSTVPTIYCTLGDIVSIYDPKAKPGGSAYRQVEKTLEELSSKPFQIDYIRTELNKKGQVIKRQTIRQQRPIIFIDEAIEERPLEGKKKTQKIINIHPIFIDQIANKYIEYPSNLIELIEKTYTELTGKKTVQREVFNLMHYLKAIASSSTGSTHSIYARNLFLKTNPKEIEQSRISKVKKKTDTGIRVLTEIGLIKKYSIKPGNTGELKYEFELNREWK